jgi:hypothetical protein
MTTPTKISELSKWEKNPRKLTPAKARILAKTLSQFGDLSGIVFNVQNKKLVGGHQRQEPLAEAKIEIVERYKKPTDQGTTAVGWAILGKERYAYREVSWDEKTHTAAAIAANKGAGEWDMSVLKDLIIELDAATMDMELTGFENTEVENILNAYKNMEVPGLSTEDVNSVIEEYSGMPEYEHEDDRPYHKILVKFEDEASFRDFLKKLGIEVSKTEKQKNIWYPERERRDMKDLAYTVETPSEQAY